MGLSLASIVSSNYDAVLYLSINSQLKEVIHLHSSQHFLNTIFLSWILILLTFNLLINTLESP